MSFSRLLKKYSQASITRPAPTDVGVNHSVEDPNRPSQRRQASDPTPSIPRPWRRKKSSTIDHGHATSPQPPPVLPSTAGERPTTEGAVSGTSPPIPATSSVFLTNMTILPQSELMPAVSPATDTLAEAWDVVKDGPQVSVINRVLDVIGLFLVQRLSRNDVLILVPR